jgi:hypothetical protein
MGFKFLPGDLEDLRNKSQFEEIPSAELISLVEVRCFEEHHVIDRQQGEISMEIREIWEHLATLPAEKRNLIKQALRAAERK